MTRLLPNHVSTAAIAVAAFGVAALIVATARFLSWLPPSAAPPILVLMAIVALIAALQLQRQAVRADAAARALEHLRARESQILDAAMDPIVTIDRDQRIVMFNAAAERAFHWPRAAVIGQKLDKLIPERFRAAHVRHVERFGATGETTRRMGGREALMALRANGEEFPIEASISHLRQRGESYYTVILRDITERVRAEQLLARSEARLRGILESAMDAVITVDDRQKIVLFNKAAEAMFECPRAEAIGAPLAWFIPERFRAGHASHMRRFGDAGGESRRMGGQRVVTGLARSGREFPMDASISQLTDDSGERFFTVILRDVTERVKAEEAVRRSRQELQEIAASANHAREQEQSRVARELHDELGQALTALKMMVAAMDRKTKPEDASAQEKLRKMRALIDETLVSTRRIASELRPLMLDDLGIVPAIEGLVEGFADRTGIACHLDIDRDLALEDAQKTAVFRIVQEALTNISRHAKATVADIGLHQRDAAIELDIRDNGVGFSPEGRHRQSRGLLGMRERTYLLGGTFSIESAPGRGTRLAIRIPVESRITAA
jgi:PAS domain S-box-containing protein